MYGTYPSPIARKLTETRTNNRAMTCIFEYLSFKKKAPKKTAINGKI